jgi:hypothetical protein
MQEEARPTEGDAFSRSCNQVWQLGDVGGDAASFILGEHLRHVSVVRIFA